MNQVIPKAALTNAFPLKLRFDPPPLLLFTFFINVEHSYNTAFNMTKRKREEGNKHHVSSKRRQTDVKDNPKPGGKSGQPTRLNSDKRSFNKSDKAPQPPPVIKPDLSRWEGVMNQLGIDPKDVALKVPERQTSPTKATPTASSAQPCNSSGPRSTAPVAGTSHSLDDLLSAEQHYDLRGFNSAFVQWSEENDSSMSMPGPVMHSLLREHQISTNVSVYGLIADTWQWSLVDLDNSINDMLSIEEVSDFAAAVGQTKAEEIRKLAASLCRFADPHPDCKGVAVVRQLEYIFALFVSELKIITTDEEDTDQRILVKCDELTGKLTQISTNFAAILHPNLVRVSPPFSATHDAVVMVWRSRMAALVSSTEDSITGNLKNHYMVFEEHASSIRSRFQVALKAYQRFDPEDDMENLAYVIEDSKNAVESLFLRPTIGESGGEIFEDTAIETSLFSDLEFGAATVVKGVSHYGNILQSVSSTDEMSSDKIQGVLAAVRQAIEQANAHFQCVIRYRVQQAIDLTNRFYRFYDDETLDQQGFFVRWGPFHSAMQQLGCDSIYLPTIEDLDQALLGCARVPIDAPHQGLSCNISDEESDGEDENKLEIRNFTGYPTGSDQARAQLVLRPSEPASTLEETESKQITEDIMQDESTVHTVHEEPTTVHHDPPIPPVTQSKRRPDQRRSGNGVTSGTTGLSKPRKPGR